MGEYIQGVDKKQFLEQVGLLADRWDWAKPMKFEWKVFRAQRSISQNNLLHQWCDDLAVYWTGHSVRIFGEQLTFTKDAVKTTMKRAFANRWPEHALIEAYDPLQKKKVPHLRSTTKYDQGFMYDCMTLMQAEASVYGCQLVAKGEFQKLLEQNQ